MFGREDAARRLWAVRQSAGAYARALCKWVLLAGSTGLLCGALGAAFHHAVELVTGVREAHSCCSCCCRRRGLRWCSSTAS